MRQRETTKKNVRFFFFATPSFQFTSCRLLFPHSFSLQSRRGARFPFRHCHYCCPFVRFCLLGVWCLRLRLAPRKRIQNETLWSQRIFYEMSHYLLSHSYYRPLGLVPISRPAAAVQPAHGTRSWRTNDKHCKIQVSPRINKYKRTFPKQ